ncbi:MAG: GntR family transcriptional regulator, partial [Mesorhizobium sp.]
AEVRSWEGANRAFHRLILAPCGMPRLLATIDDLHAASARFLFAAWRSEWETRTDQDHRAILAALRQGNTESAAATLGRHVQW